MSSKMTKKAYEQIIAEDIAWLEKQPRTLERDHIIEIVKRSPGYEYPPPYGDPARADERAKVVSAIRVRQTSEQVMHDRHAAEPEPNEWTRRRIDETRATVAVLRDLADAIERGDHEVKP